MPYTPPAQQSPVASKSGSPTTARPQFASHTSNHHRFQYPAAPSPGPRPGLPRSHSSTTYLHKHRRAPSVSKNFQQSTTLSTEHGQDDHADTKAVIDPHSSLRQSPPPVTNNIIPTGLVISPPDSQHNSSDEEEKDGAKRGRSRALPNLHELEEAVRIIGQNRSGSPNGRLQHPALASRSEFDIDTTLASSLEAFNVDRKGPIHALTQEARKITHSRSTTDSGIEFATPVDSPVQLSDASDDEEQRPKPPMLRKKSGELVRPALRASSRRRPSSMPGTPTYSKAVHFDSHLEHVRHFLKVDKPAAVSAGSSPVETEPVEYALPSGKPFEWELNLPNFPHDTAERRTQPVRVEKVYLSGDKKHLIGNVAVANLSFHKQVTARFTLDNWKTTSEVSAVYTSDVRKKQVNDGYDRFNFDIQLEDLVNLDKKTLFFCIRYNTAGQEFWDNNGHVNYQVDFSKKVKATGASSLSPLGQRPLSALPRSRPSPPFSGQQTVTSLPRSFDDFSAGFDNWRGLEPSRGRLRRNSIRDSDEESIEVPPARLRPTVNTTTFGSRYDFGRSLSAALNAASTALGDKSGLDKKKTVKQDVPGLTKPAPTAETTDRPADIVSEKPSHQSQTYQDLVNKFCFFGSAKVSPQMSTKSPHYAFDGSADGASMGSPQSSLSSTTSSKEGSPEMKEQAEHIEIVPSYTHGRSTATRSGYATAPAGTRNTSPNSYRFPYHQPIQTGFFEPQGPMVVRP